MSSWIRFTTLDGGISALPPEVAQLHGLEKQSSGDWYTLHGNFDFCEHHVQRVREVPDGYEITFAGAYMFLNKNDDGFKVQVRY